VEPEAKKKQPKKRSNEIMGSESQDEEEEDAKFDQFLSDFER